MSEYGHYVKCPQRESMSGEKKRRVEHDTDACVGHGRCDLLAPRVFDKDEQGHGVVKVAMVGAEMEESARLAAENCPEDAISLRSDMGSLTKRHELRRISSPFSGLDLSSPPRGCPSVGSGEESSAPPISIS